MAGERVLRFENQNTCQAVIRNDCTPISVALHEYLAIGELFELLRLLAGLMGEGFRLFSA